MIENSDKPPSKPPGRPSADGQDPGRLGKDDLGNVTWEWSDDEDLQADDLLGTADRLRVLVEPTLDVVDEEAPNSVQHNPFGLAKGYDPYSSGALGKQAWKKTKNLRELSKWIELKKKLEPKKGGK